MPPRVMEARWWLKTYGLKPWEVDRLTLEQHDLFPVIEQAAQVAQARAQAAANRSRGSR